jgi:hypothetical protein
MYQALHIAQSKIFAMVKERVKGGSANKTSAALQQKP